MLLLPCRSTLATPLMMASSITSPSQSPYADYVAEASQRFDVPAQWIWAVMRAESGGDVQSLSPKGAMGLMQLMPATWADLRARYGLGNDPYDPHDNILGGAAYIKEMYDLFGAPGFIGAYNAGPARYQDYLTTGQPLPDETVAYMENVGRMIDFNAGASIAANGHTNPLPAAVAPGPPIRPIAPGLPPLRVASGQPHRATAAGDADDPPAPRAMVPRAAAGNFGSGTGRSVIIASADPAPGRIQSDSGSDDTPIEPASADNPSPRQTPPDLNGTTPSAGTVLPGVVLDADDDNDDDEDKTTTAIVPRGGSQGRDILPAVEDIVQPISSGRPFDADAARPRTAQPSGVTPAPASDTGSIRPLRVTVASTPEVWRGSESDRDDWSDRPRSHSTFSHSGGHTARVHSR